MSSSSTSSRDGAEEISYLRVGWEALLLDAQVRGERRERLDGGAQTGAAPISWPSAVVPRLARCCALPMKSSRRRMPGRLPARSHGRRADDCHLHDHHGRRAGHPDALAAAEGPARAVRAADARMGRPRRARGGRGRRRWSSPGRRRPSRSRRALPGVRVVVQSPANGTGHAVRSASRPCRRMPSAVVVLSGDTPLIDADTIRRAIEACAATAGRGARQRAARAAARLRPRRARRRARGPHRRGARRDAPRSCAIDEFNVGLYCFRRAALARRAAAARRRTTRRASST